MEKNVSRFRGKLVKMIRDAGSKFDFRLELGRFCCFGVMNLLEKIFY